MKFNADEGNMINLGGNCANFTHAVSNDKLNIAIQEWDFNIYTPMKALFHCSTMVKKEQEIKSY